MNIDMNNDLPATMFDASHTMPSLAASTVTINTFINDIALLDEY